MLHGFMPTLELFAKPIVGSQFIGTDSSRLIDRFSDRFFQRCGGNVGNRVSDDVSVPFNKRDYRSLLCSASAFVRASAGTGFAADVGFIHFDCAAVVAEHSLQWFFLHRVADAMAKMPS